MKDKPILKQNKKNDKITKIENNNSVKNKIKIDKESDLYNLPFDIIKNTKIYDFYGKYYDFIFNKAIKMENENKNNNNENSGVPTKKPNKKIIINIKRKYILRRNQLKKQLLDREIDMSFKSDFSINNDFSINSSFNDNSLMEHSFFDNSINTSNNKDISDSINYNNNIDVNPYLSRSMVLSNIKVLREFKIKRLTFEIKYDTIMGESVAIIGSINELGSWKRKKALQMKWSEGNIWKTSMNYNNTNDVKDFEYKFVVMSNNHIKHWEDGNNRKFIISKIRGLIEPYLDSFYGPKTVISSTDYSTNQSFKYNISDYSLSIISNWR